MFQGIGALMVSRVAGTKFFRSLTLDQPSSDLTDFPVLFTGTFTYLKTVANGGKVQHGSGYDIVFYSDAALTTKLKFERVSWSASTGTCEFWIKIPTLTSASAKVIYLSYGDTSITTDQQDANNTWNSGYNAVWHFADGTTLSGADSTSNGNTLTITSATATSGQIDGAAATDNLQRLSRAAITIPTTGSITGWIYVNETISGSSYEPWFEVRNTSPVQIFSLDLFHNTMFGGWYDNGNDKRAAWAISGVSQATWYYVSVTWTNGGTTTVYFNAVSKATSSSLNATWNTSGKTTYLNFDAQNTIYGKSNLDEFRISNVVRPVEWLAAEYSNQNDPANFYIIGVETPS